jgi:hypothetical protein
MRGTDLPEQAWHKSSYSNGQGDCIEVAHLEGGVATRDSKDPSGPALRFSADGWGAFIRGLAEGDFERP